MTWWPTPFLCRWIQTAELQNVTNIIMERSVLKNLHIGYLRFLEEQAILPNQVILIKICSTNRKSCLQISDCVIDMIVLVHRDFSKNGNFSALLRTVLYSALSYSGCAQDDQYLASCAPGVATHHWPPQSCWCSAVDDDSDNVLSIWENNQHVVQAVWRRFGDGRPERGMAKSRSVAGILVRFPDPLV